MNQPNWISVKERMPPNDDDVLVFEIYGHYGIAFWGSDCPGICAEEWHAQGERNECDERHITHWMELPKEPV